MLPKLLRSLRLHCRHGAVAWVSKQISQKNSSMFFPCNSLKKIVEAIFTAQVIQEAVTFIPDGWRSRLQPLKGSCLRHPKKSQKQNCQGFIGLLTRWFCVQYPSHRVIWLNICNRNPPKKKHRVSWSKQVYFWMKCCDMLFYYWLIRPLILRIPVIPSVQRDVTRILLLLTMFVVAIFT